MRAKAFKCSKGELFSSAAPIRLVSALQGVKASAWGELGKDNSLCLRFLGTARSGAAPLSGILIPNTTALS